MPANHNGNSTGLTPGQQVTITNPVDGDPLSAASNNVATTKLADHLQFLQERALLGKGHNNLATGSDPGGKFTGAAGPSGGPGVDGTGGGLNPGVRGTGSPGGSEGGIFTATDDKPGVVGTGGPGSGPGPGGAGGEFYGGGTNGPGVTARGFGTGRGGQFTAESSLAGEFSRDDAGTASLLESVRVANGYLLLGGSAPASNVALPARALHQGLVPKAWGVITWSNGAPVIDTLRSMNVASLSFPSPVNGRIDITLATVPTRYIVLPVGNFAFDARVDPVANPGRIHVHQPGTTTPVDFTVTSGSVAFVVMGFD